jgi:hypothetical protein
MSGETIISIPLKWLRTVEKDFYFEMYREMYFENECTMRETWYLLENVRSDMHLPEMYSSFQSFKRNYYKWVNNKVESNNMLPEKSDKASILR